MGLKTSDPAAVRWAMSAEPGEFDILPHKEKRSMNANNYMWTLCDKLSEKLHVTKDDIYRQAIRDVGIWKDYELQGDCTTLLTGWTRQGIGWFYDRLDYTHSGDGYTYRVYYGSSVYNTKQMSRLIDYIVDECKDQGIETMPPEKLNALLEEWQ